jgi:hypothetical protein
MDRSWQVKSPDLDLLVSPLYTHHTQMKMPPVLPYVSIDYYEVLLNVEGTVLAEANKVNIKGIGKFDHNFNFW